MTKAQTSLYWCEWAAVRRADPDADRHALHLAALGRDTSSKTLTNRQLDRVLAEFRAVSRPNSVGSQLRQIEQPRTRMLWKIQVEQAAILRLYGHDPESYIISVIADKFPSRRQRTAVAMSGDGPLGLDELLSDISHHPVDPDRPSELEQLLMTLTARTDRMRQEAGHHKAEMIELSKPYRTAAPAAEKHEAEPELAAVTEENPF